MKDKYERNIDYIRISVTDRCNLRCRYCMPDEQVPVLPDGELLSFEEIERVCRILPKVGIRRIKLTGGEPLVRKGIAELITRLKKVEGIEQVTLTTNGTLLADRIKELEAAGIDGINVSLDTLDPERFGHLTQRRRLEDVLRGIEALQTSDIPRIKLNCVPMEEINGDELARLAALAKDSRLAVRFIEMMPVGNGQQWTMIPEQTVKDRLTAAFGPMTPAKGSFGSGPAAYYMLPGFRSPVGFISAMSHMFCSSCNRIRLTPDGFLKSCLFFGGGTDLKHLLRSGADEELLDAAVRETIWKKPRQHPDGQAEENRKMYQIGG